MSVFFRVPIGLVIIAIGFLMVWKTIPLQGFTGSIPFAEEKFGPGGTNTFLKLLGIVVVFVGIAVVSNIISDVLTSFANIFIPGKRR